MTGASLGYDGYYSGTTLTQANRLGAWWAATIYGSNFSYRLQVDLNNNIINPQGNSNKYMGRSVRYHTTQREPEALIIGVHLKQTRTIHTQEVTNGTIINSRGPVVAMQRLVVKPT